MDRSLEELLPRGGRGEETDAKHKTQGARRGGRASIVTDGDRGAPALSLPRRLLKQGLTALGSQLSLPILHQLEMTLNYMKVGRWMADHRFRVGRRVADRIAVMRSVADRVRDQKVLYLEFGVYKGASIRFWSQALRHPEATLHGFDSFEGLPDVFDGRPRGHFSTRGTVPHIDDPRVRFFAGWFDQVLPSYTLPPHDVLVITMDADLYASTIYVLRHLRPWITPGTYIYFDDMFSTDHEPRALHEFMHETGLEFSVVCADSSLTFVFFRCEGKRPAALADAGRDPRGGALAQHHA